MRKIHPNLTASALPLPCNDCLNVTSLMTLISRYYFTHTLATKQFRLKCDGA